MEKHTIEECCEEFLSDQHLKQGMQDLLLFLQELKMKPLWYHKASYKCNYKSKPVLHINMGKENWLRIRVCLVTVNEMQESENMDLYMSVLNDDLSVAHENYLAGVKSCEWCKGCGGFCEKRKRSYYINNPTKEQFDLIKSFIMARKEFITKYYAK